MKLVHDGNNKPVRRSLRPHAAIAAAVLALSCASGRALMNPPVAEPPFESAPAMATGVPRADDGTEKIRGILVSQWTLGRCLLEGRRLSYSDNLSSRNADILLDSEPSGAKSIICSDRHTVILLPSKAILAIGGEDVISGREMLGFMGGRLIAANSIEVSLAPALESGAEPSSAEITGERLTFRASGGRIWAIELGNPFSGWHIY